MDSEMGDATNVQQSQVVKDEECLIDITSLVHQCADGLSFAKPMVATPSFSLPDSMAAMELLDSKMDSCEIPASQIQHRQDNDNNNSKEKILFPRPAPTELDNEFVPLPWDDLTTNDAAFFAVEALVRLESMLEGSSVVESTYTCLYAHNDIIVDMKSRLNPPSESLTEKFENLLLNPNKQPRGTVAQHVVYAASLALVELTEILRSIILHGDIYEEEDFCANTYNIPVYSNKERGSVENELTYALRLAEQQQTEAQDSDDVQAVVHILGFLLDFLAIATSVARVAGSEVIETMKKTKEMCVSAVQKLDNLRITFSRLNAQKSERVTQVLHRAFDPFVNRPLFGNSPVRKVVFHEADESLKIISRIVSEIDWALCDVVIHGTSLSRIRRMVERLSKLSVNVLSRSLIVLNLYFDDKLLGRFSLMELMMKDMQELADVPSDLLESKEGGIFLNRMAKPIYDTLKLQLLNRNRQRTYLEAVILQDWAQLQQEAHVVDVHFRKENGLDSSFPPHFSHYVLNTLVGLMDLHCSVGVELGLFCGEEDLSVVYWYRDFLISTLLNNLQAMRRTKDVASANKAQESSTKTQKGKKKNVKNGSDIHKSKTNRDEDLWYEFDILALSMKRGLCRGLVRFIAALHQAEVLQKTKFEFTTQERKFQKRFEVFSAIKQPPPLTCDDFINGSDFSRVSQVDLLFSTIECFKSSKTMVSQMLDAMASLEPLYLPILQEELNDIAKVCVGNSVYLQKLKQLVNSKERGTDKVVFELGSNKEFCTIKLA